MIRLEVVIPKLQIWLQLRILHSAAKAQDHISKTHTWGAIVTNCVTYASLDVSKNNHV